MQLEKLCVFQYRNFDQQELHFSPGINLLIGRNGQGKTNLLEAIYLLGYGRSFRTSSTKECIQHGRTEAAVSGTMTQGGLVRELQIRFSTAQKKVILNHKQTDLEEFAGNLHLLAMTQEHLKVVRGGPAERRAFLDRAMILLFPGHLRSLALYGRALKQRNTVLAQALERGSSVDEILIESWEEALILNGVRILSNRRKCVDMLKQEIPNTLFSNDILKMHYFSTVHSETSDNAELEMEFRNKLRKARMQDQRVGNTSVGPHRDDLKLFVNGKSLVDFGSAGQQRSGLLSLYFAQMEIHRKIHHFYPIFLMDDAEAELDEVVSRPF